MGSAVIFKDYPSKRTPGHNHRAQVDPSSGLISCGCRRWINKRDAEARYCPHTDALIQEFGLTVEVRDGQRFMVGRGVARTPAKVRELTAQDLGIATKTAFLQPMLASPLPTGRDADSFPAISYVMEEKFDGHRIVMAISSKQEITAWTRGEKVRTLPTHVAAVAQRLPSGIYDGELIIPGKHSYDVTAGMNSGSEVLVLFDALKVMTEEATYYSYDERRALLKLAFSALPKKQVAIKLAEQFSPSMAEVRRIWKRGGEGAIIKSRNGHYQPGYRTADWIKIKKVASAVLVITGYEAGKVGAYSAVKIRDSKGIETSVKTLNNETMRQMAKDPDSFIGRSLVISYQERTSKDKYRHPMWDHLLETGL